MSSSIDECVLLKRLQDGLLEIHTCVQNPRKRNSTHLSSALENLHSDKLAFPERVKFDYVQNDILCLA